MSKELTNHDLNNFLWAFGDLLGGKDSIMEAWQNSDPNNKTIVQSFVKSIIVEDIVAEPKEKKASAIEHLERYLSDSDDEELESFWNAYTIPFPLGVDKKFPFQVVLDTLRISIVE